MRQLVNRLGDRLLGAVAPRVTARAAQALGCSVDWSCRPPWSCYKRYICDTGNTPWQKIDCCISECGC